MEYKSYRDPDSDDSEEANLARFHLEENHCIGNIIEALAEMVAADGEKNLCSVCCFAKVTILPKGTEAYRGCDEKSGAQNAK